MTIPDRVSASFPAAAPTIGPGVFQETAMGKLITTGALALATVALPAQSVDINGGLHTGLSLPVGDLHDKTGLGTNQFFGAHIGGHLDFNLTPHHQIRGHLTYHNMPGSGWGGPDDFK